MQKERTEIPVRIEPGACDILHVCFFPRDSDHIPPPISGTVPAALVPLTRSHKFTWPCRAGHGHIPSSLGRLGCQCPTWLRPTRIRSQVTSLLGFRPTRITGRTLGSGRLGSQRPVTSHDADHIGYAGPGHIPPVRVHATEGQMKIVKMSMPQATDPAGPGQGPGV